MRLRVRKSLRRFEGVRETGVRLRDYEVGWVVTGSERASKRADFLGQSGRKDEWDQKKLDFNICTMEIHAAMTIAGNYPEIETFDFSPIC